ncbi:hypothetical protein FRB97_001089 [Tulasnella sp. 331]|nr:hypothetical protein FRB97_001089 [Tulasnella sp. 331]
MASQDVNPYTARSYVNPDDADIHTGDGDDAGSPLLGGPRKQAVEESPREGTASSLSGIGNLLNTIVGTGMLSFPLAMASSGLLPGILTCIFSGAVASFGLHLLSICATQTAHRKASFFAISEMTFPRAAVFFDAAIAIKCFGVSISYLIIIKGLAPSVLKSLFHVMSPSTELPDWSLDGRVWVTIFMFILAPLCFLRRLDSLRHTSYIAVVSVVYLVVVVVACHYKPPKGSSPPGEVHLIRFTGTFVSTFPVQVFAFTCAQNLFPIYNEMFRNTQKRMNTVIVSALGTATIIYEVVSVFGYLTFGSKVGANIIAMYPSTTLFIAFGQFAIMVNVMCSYPLQVHPCRNSMDKVVSAKKKLVSGGSGIGHPEEDDSDDTQHGGDLDHTPSEMSARKHIIVTSVIVASGYAVAFFVSDLQMGSTTISFILPGLLYYKVQSINDFFGSDVNNLVVLDVP